MNDAPTPRSDAAEIIQTFAGLPPVSTRRVSVDFARKLECELAASVAENHSLKFRLKQEQGLNRDHEDDYLAVWAAIKQPNETVVQAAQRIVRELAAERALADKMAETLANVQGDYSATGAVMTSEVEESIAAWKEARK